MVLGGDIILREFLVLLGTSSTLVQLLQAVVVFQIHQNFICPTEYGAMWYEEKWV